RLQEAVGTIKALVEKGAKVLVCGHFGRPEGKEGDREKFSLRPIGARLGELLGLDVQLVDFESEGYGDALRSQQPGTVVLLENIRFYSGEKAKDPEKRLAFARAIFAPLGDDAAVVIDAFGTAHREDASMVAFPKVASESAFGACFLKEASAAAEIRNAESGRLAVIVGGKKLEKANTLLALMELPHTRVIAVLGLPS